MSISVPYSYVTALEDFIYDGTSLSTIESLNMARLISAIAVDTAEQGLAEAKLYARQNDDTVRNDIDSSLNAITDWTRDELDIIIDTYGKALTTALTSLGDAQSTASDTIAETFEDTVGLVAEGYSVASEYVGTAIAETGTWFDQTIEWAGDMLKEEFNISIAIFDKLTEELLKIPAGLIKQATEILLPAQGDQWSFLMGKFVQSNPLTSMLYSVKELFVEGLGEALTIDENEMGEWIRRTFMTIQEYSLQTLKE